MRGVRFAGLLGMAMIAGALAGCVDEQIVYRDKPLFEDPPQAAVGFFGYSNAEQKQTTCGNCHNGQQVTWVKSKHASAWEDLQDSGHANDTCNDCHTVSGLGNPTAKDVKVGYAGTKDSRYEDVQCESCHGGGVEHVKDPSAKQPIASIVASKDATNGCGECHSGDHNPFVEEWEGSLHGEWNSHATSTGCPDCHEAKSILANKFGVKTTYLEQNDTTHIGVTCVVCHDPHGNANPAQVRMLASSHTGSTNLCYQCHQRRPVPDGTTARNSAHSPQGPMVMGDKVGWQPPSFPTDKIVGTHSSDANPGLCQTCHMASYSPVAGKYTVGHTFKAIPCKDATGMVTNAADCEMSTRSFKSCLGSGCHGSEAAARSALTAAEGRLTSLSTELKRVVALAKLTTKGKADWVSDANVTPLEGADFNSTLMEHDLSRGAHNPFYMDALLNSSISYIKTYYGVQ